MLARVTTFAVDGVDARRVWVEADIRQGLPAFTVVGLADKAVREARERVRAAMVNSGYEFPLRRITVNLAPAYLRKVGPAFDLPLAVALLIASYQLEPEHGRGLRGRRGALADRRGAADPRRARRRRGRPSPRAARGSWCRCSRAREAALVSGHRGGRHRLAAGDGRDAARRRRAAVGPGRAGRGGRAGGRARGRPRPQRPHSRPRGRGRRRPQPVPPGPAGHGQDDDRAAPAVDPPAAGGRTRRSR